MRPANTGQAFFAHALSQPPPGRSGKRRARAARAPLRPPYLRLFCRIFTIRLTYHPPARILGPKRFKSVYQPEFPGKPIPASPSGRVKTAPRGILRAYSERDDVVPSRIRPQNPPGRPFQTLAGTPWQSVSGGSLRMACRAGKPIPAGPGECPKTAPREILRAYSARDDVVSFRIRPQNVPRRSFDTFAGTRGNGIYAFKPSGPKDPGRGGGVSDV